MGFSEDRAKGRYGPRYVLVAENPYVLWDAIEDWKRTWRAAPGATLPLDVFRPPRIDFDKLLDVGATISMFSEDRLVVVHDIHKIPATQQARLAAILGRFGESTKVMLAGASLDKRTKLYKFLKGWAAIEEFPRIYADRLAGWAQRIAGEFGWQLAPAASTLLASTYGDDLFSVRQTIERVTLFVSQRRRIELEDIEMALVGEGTHTVFLLLDSVARSDLGRALSIVRSLFAGDDYPEIWLAALASLLQRLLKLAELNEPNDMQAARLAGIHPQFIGQSRRQVAFFGANGLCVAIESCFTTEWAIKTSQIPSRLGWELLIYRLCSKKALLGRPIFDLASPKTGE